MDPFHEIHFHQNSIHFHCEWTIPQNIRLISQVVKDSQANFGEYAKGVIFRECAPQPFSVKVNFSEIDGGSLFALTKKIAVAYKCQTLRTIGFSSEISLDFFRRGCAKSTASIILLS